MPAQKLVLCSSHLNCQSEQIQSLICTIQGGGKTPFVPYICSPNPYLAWIRVFSLEYVSVAIIIASLKLAAPTGMIMNSWNASSLPAWTPQLMTLRQGTGRTCINIICRLNMQSKMMDVLLRQDSMCHRLRLIFALTTACCCTRRSPDWSCQLDLQCVGIMRAFWLRRLPAYRVKKSCISSSFCTFAANQAVLYWFSCMASSLSSPCAQQEIRLKLHSLQAVTYQRSHQGRSASCQLQIVGLCPFPA